MDIRLTLIILGVFTCAIAILAIMLWDEVKENVELQIKLAAVEAERDTALREYMSDKKLIRSFSKRNKNMKEQLIRVGPYERKYNKLVAKTLLAPGWVKVDDKPFKMNL